MKKDKEQEEVVEELHYEGDCLEIDCMTKSLRLASRNLNVVELFELSKDIKETFFDNNQKRTGDFYG